MKYIYLIRAVVFSMYICSSLLISYELLCPAIIDPSLTVRLKTTRYCYCYFVVVVFLFFSFVLVYKYVDKF